MDDKAAAQAGNHEHEKQCREFKLKIDALAMQAEEFEKLGDMESANQMREQLTMLQTSVCRDLQIGERTNDPLIDPTRPSGRVFQPSVADSSPLQTASEDGSGVALQGEECCHQRQSNGATRPEPPGRRLTAPVGAKPKRRGEARDPAHRRDREHHRSHRGQQRRCRHRNKEWPPDRGLGSAHEPHDGDLFGVAVELEMDPHRRQEHGAGHQQQPRW